MEIYDHMLFDIVEINIFPQTSVFLINEKIQRKYGYLLVIHIICIMLIENIFIGLYSEKVIHAES